MPKECAVENYFYCHEDKGGQRSWVAENFLADLESASGDVLKAAQAGNLPTTQRDRFTLTGYAAMSFVRTPSGKRLIDQAGIEQSVQQIRDLVNDPVRHAEYCAAMERETGKPLDPVESKRILSRGRVHAVQTNRAWSLRTMAEMLMLFQAQFMHMHLVLLHADDAFFLTSDCPVTVHDPEKRPPLHAGARHLDMRFPVSLDYCLAGSFTPGPSRLELQREEVEKMNRMLIRQAHRFVYARFDADYIQPALKASLAKKAAQKPDGTITFF